MATWHIGVGRRGARRGLCHQLCFEVSDSALHLATVQLMFRLLSLSSFSSTPRENQRPKNKKRPLCRASSYEILKNPLDAPWPSHSYLKISFENNLSNKWKTYLLPNLSCDLTFWAQPQQKQKDEAEACRGSAAVCVSIWGGSIDFGSAILTSPMLTGLLS